VTDSAPQPPASHTPRAPNNHLIQIERAMGFTPPRAGVSLGVPRFFVSGRS
jgi:hypothetical protein